MRWRRCWGRSAGRRGWCIRWPISAPRLLQHVDQGHGGVSEHLPLRLIGRVKERTSPEAVVVESPIEVAKAVLLQVARHFLLPRLGRREEVVIPACVLPNTAPFAQHDGGAGGSWDMSPVGIPYSRHVVGEVTCMHVSFPEIMTITMWGEDELAGVRYLHWVGVVRDQIFAPPTVIM